MKDIPTLAASIILAAGVIVLDHSSIAYSQDYTGYQELDGTRVYTEVFSDRGYARFSNSCGSQIISQQDLQRGAKPYNIVPCPRPNATPPVAEAPRGPVEDEQTAAATRNPAVQGRRLWAAVAAGVERGFFRSQVAVGYAADFPSKEEAERYAKKQCKKHIDKCKVVASWNSGCYYITLTEDKKGVTVAWGSGPTVSSAYNECMKSSKGKECRTEPLGKCYPR